MNKNLQWKVITVIAVGVVFFSIGVYPLLAARYQLPIPGWLQAQQLKLGLDLKGGVHLVLRVNTDDALRITTATTGEQLRESLRAGGVTVSAIDVQSPTTFRVEGVPSDRVAEFRRIADEQTAANYNRASGPADSYDFTLKPNIEIDLREQAVVQAIQTIDRRVNELGVVEPTISRYGQSREEILVQLPGESDVTRAKKIIGNTAVLELRIVEAGPASSREALLQQYGGTLPQDMEVLSGAGGSPDTATSFYLFRKVAAITGKDVRNARSSLDENNRPAVSFTMTTDGARKFGRLTGENIGRQLAIILDNRVQSAARIEGRIDTEGRIYGSFTSDEVADLSLILRSGALPASLTTMQEQLIGPSLGAESIRSGVIAATTGLLVVVVFMLVFYKLAGVNAVVALVMNLLILIGLMAYFGATMTLPGIAGFVLTMGIGVDSNVLIFERIKEELAAKGGVRPAVNAGFSRVFWTLFDTHIASLIAAMFLFQFGTGPIRGFATTLTIGLLTNLFTSLFVSKTLFELELSRRRSATATLSI